MSFSHNYLTRRFLLQNYRDYVAVTMIGTWALGYTLRSYDDRTNSNYMAMRMINDDESDITYREATNKTDAAVRRRHALNYSEKIKKLRAEKEREAALDAFNYLYKKDL
eukprot:CAMPEP_0176374486 /NCGR_PEP_ID=MMETSP0126-20121128/26790_1 /TAXON_ID=141414 ORGANISM="Strombidinopsis acuminatum, Strain SPMC142" /NCGR_SAMPLE_ID=MMETSP0126 /ASSEMBLY_ACC=CAM_ASM_000229 /LENGTH=108 /DNA_ID=CAMNT_0017735079 /DNA_START=12 /DNA_END=338 /DNA_ORIENTATION=+